MERENINEKLLKLTRMKTLMMVTYDFGLIYSHVSQ